MPQSCVATSFAGRWCVAFAVAALAPLPAYSTPSPVAVESRGAAYERERTRANAVAELLIRREQLRAGRARSEGPPVRASIAGPGPAATRGVEPAADAGFAALFETGTSAEPRREYPPAVVTGDVPESRSLPTPSPPPRVAAAPVSPRVEAPVPDAPFLLPPAPPLTSEAPVPVTGGSGGDEGVALFHSGYSRYSQGDYEHASDAFRTFLAAHPAHDLSDNAQYWLGECAFARGRYEEALTAYQRVIDLYPLGDKVPDALLKTGMSLEAMRRVGESREAYSKVVDGYPGTPQARRASERLLALDNAAGR